jgi:CheY-like chemotaxis protein
MPFEPTQPSTWNLVIADNEPDSIGIVELVFKFHNARVRSAISGLACITLLNEELPDVLFLDIQMPGMTGWDVLKHIRGDSKMKDLVVIAMTANAMYGDRERTLNAGFNHYLAKPLSPLSLIADVTRLLIEKQRIREANERLQPPAQTGSPIS